MLITNIVRNGHNPEQVRRVVEESAADVSPNVIASAEVDGNNVRFTLKALNSRGEYARLSPSGRRTTSANFEAHFRVMADVFRAFPNVTIRSALATFKGYEDFLERWPSVGARNVGAPVAPVRFDSL